MKDNFDNHTRGPRWSRGYTDHYDFLASTHGGIFNTIFPLFFTIYQGFYSTAKIK